MYNNYVFQDVNEALPRLLAALRQDGLEIGSRAGLTQELTHVGITLSEPCDREILLSHRRPNLAAQIAETMWVLAGHDDIGWLEHYLPRAREFSDDGLRWRAGYGARLRSWPRRDGSGDVVDQWRWLVNHLKEDRSSRRAVMSIWDPIIDTVPGKDIPCNDWLSFLSRNGYLDLHVALRSNDIIWGWSGINQFEWSSLLEITAGMLGLKVGSLHFSTTSFHIYGHHFGKAQKIEDEVHPDVSALHASSRFDAATVGRDFDRLDDLLKRWFLLEKQIRHGDMSHREVDAFPEPMLRSWLRVIQWWWSGSSAFLLPLGNSRLKAAARYSVQPPQRERVEVHIEERSEPVAVINLPVPALREQAISQAMYLISVDQADHVKRTLARFGAERVVALKDDDLQPFLDALSEPQPEPTSAFLDYATRTHNEKHEAYGDSWKRRGEMLGIMANIARKVDRLGGSETADETSADTAMDLMVYLAKYHVWLNDNVEIGLSDHPDAANDLLLNVERQIGADLEVEQEATEDFLRGAFDRLETMVMNEVPDRDTLVMDMLWEAYRLARMLFDEAVEADGYRGADVD